MRPQVTLTAVGQDTLTIALEMAEAKSLSFFILLDLAGHAFGPVPFVFTQAKRHLDAGVKPALVTVLCARFESPLLYRFQAFSSVHAEALTMRGS